jgi:DNA-binding GntR family transcriptional regulator
MAPKKARNLSKDTRFAEVVDQLAGGYKTIGQMVYAVLREAILSGAFAPGEWLRQESLAAAIGVSRIPVRTALLQLESEGLVNFHPHRGARVRTLSPAQINEIYRLRTLLESYALRLSMTKMTPARLAALRDLAQQLDEQPEGGEFLDIRVRFYRELYDTENNPLLVEMIEELRSHVGRYLLGFRFDHHNHSRHVDLIDHVAAGDLTGAEAWLYSHLEGVRAGIQALATEELGEASDAGDDAGLAGLIDASDIDEAAELAAAAVLPAVPRKPPARRAAGAKTGSGAARGESTSPGHTVKSTSRASRSAR